MITDICIQSIQQIKITGRKLWYLNYCNKKERKQTINTNLKLTVRDLLGEQARKFFSLLLEILNTILRPVLEVPVNAGMEMTFYTRLGL